MLGTISKQAEQGVSQFQCPQLAVEGQNRVTLAISKVDRTYRWDHIRVRSAHVRGRRQRLKFTATANRSDVVRSRAACEDYDVPIRCALR